MVTNATPNTTNVDTLLSTDEMVSARCFWRSAREAFAERMIRPATLARDTRCCELTVRLTSWSMARPSSARTAIATTMMITMLMAPVIIAADLSFNQSVTALAWTVMSDNASTAWAADRMGGMATKSPFVSSIRRARDMRTTQVYPLTDLNSRSRRPPDRRPGGGE